MKRFFFILLVVVSCKSQEKILNPVVQGGESKVSPFDPNNPSEIIPMDPDGNPLGENGGSATPSGEGSSEEKKDEFNTLGSGGRKGYFESLNTNLEFLANVPQDNSDTKSHGLLILLHGSGGKTNTGSSYRRYLSNTNEYGSMRGVAEANGLIPVAVLAPTGTGWNEARSDALLFADADALHNLIQDHLYKQYNIDKRKVFFSGQSSGGGFLSSHFVAKYGHLYQGGAFMQCGMQPPPRDYRIQVSDGFSEKFKLHFEITRNDSIWLNFLRPSVLAYQNAGYDVTYNDTKPGGHCNFDQPVIIQENIGRMLPK